MPGQEQQRPTRRDDEPEDLPAPAPAAPRAQKSDDDVDAILDEIDETLEANAETFVREYIQKGGE